jgi:hypothetical protein
MLLNDVMPSSTSVECDGEKGKRSTRTSSNVLRLASTLTLAVRLAEVELSEGVVEIGEDFFGCCGHIITNLNIPTHSGGLVISHFGYLSVALFFSTMALNALEMAHSHKL